jgi:predicted ribosome quality control (RQC) complex YloA/Tae2 family protein
LLQRLAEELDRVLHGTRIKLAGRRPDGRFGLRVAAGTVMIDAFGPTPLVTLEDDAPLTHEAGWVRTMADVLEGLRIEGVRARRGDRLIAFECAARSRFGVESGYRLVAELVPRFGNILLLKDDTIVSAAKEFTRAENARRAIVAGEAYEPPPLQMVPRVLAAGPPEAGDIYAYWEGDDLAAAYVAPLPQFSDLQVTREPALLPLLSSAARSAAGRRFAQAFAARRAALGERIATRLRTLTDESAALVRERDDDAARDDLRSAGDLLYAHAHEIDRGAKTFSPSSAPGRTIALDPERDAKCNAAAFFKRYRKAVAKAEHARARLDELAGDIHFAEQLLWELDRSESDTLADVTEGVERLERRKAAARRTAQRRGKPLEVRLSEEARVYVGRSPRGNAELTFRIARPDDLWFHARNTPGAHVVLHIDSGRTPNDAELERAASLAAYHSKARSSERVDVDYTERKFVRRRPNAPPGLVWYTNARTIAAAPGAA